VSDRRGQAVGIGLGVALGGFALAPVISFWVGVVSRAFYLGRTA
jgi:hypothetical protein